MLKKGNVIIIYYMTYFEKKKCHNHNNIKLNIEQAKNSTQEDKERM